MAHGEHHYRVTVTWTGNTGSGTSGYRDYRRDHVVSAAGRPAIAGSSDPAFRGDASRWNPEDLLLASASACHQLWYLHLCADAGIAVLAYEDSAEATMVDGEGGHFTRIVLRPRVTVRAGDDLALAERLHHAAHAQCFVANSLKTPIDCVPVIVPATA
ncbi:OsmC family protein [Bordetella genomosp. 1]|uniref:Peroxiredoxin n=1 Tax=Bordetella genomosp. 1 TaxID=1395607 RepID=A0ABX4F3A3_9BORD|nr:OsmC family protein [Bordetella genomosp. 1]MDQ8031926.1 OsmC family protein [Bordetella sp.]OZI68198.1 peroxiredoxin [Bordetella genomosp. 1]